MMKNENDRLDKLFSSLEEQWDIEHPNLGHQERFLNRLEGKKKNRFSLRIAVPVAAAIAILMGLLIVFNPMQERNMAANKMSPQAKEAQVYFSSIIEKELAKVEKENSPETRKIVSDALNHMRQLEDDYNSLIEELREKGENKKILHAMITNLQVRITFLEKVLAQIENIKKIKESHNENNII
jgi:cytoskeletal protein RodZ